MVIVSQPTSNQNTRAILRALANDERLTAFFTSISVPAQLLRFTRGSLAKELARRSFPEAGGSLIVHNPIPEVFRLLSGKNRFAREMAAPFLDTSVAALYSRHDQFVARRIAQFPADAVLACSGGALRTFQAVEDTTFRKTLELPIAYNAFIHPLIEAEHASFPQLYGEYNRPKLDEGRYAEELRLADKIIAPSTFVAHSLSGIDGIRHKVEIIPYGMPTYSQTQIRTPRRFLKVLFVGSVTSRKGVAYLFNAIRQLGETAQLTIIGPIDSNPSANLRTELSNHRYLSTMPHPQVLAEMDDHDVLVLPSLAEGMALVVGEALSRGLPVVATENCGVDSWLKDGINGFIVPIRNSDAIAHRLESLISEKGLLESLSAGTSLYRRSWLTYGNDIKEVLRPRSGSNTALREPR